MKAYVQRRYGGPDVLELVEVPRPVPQAGEVLVRVRAATVSSGDARVRAFNVPPMFRLPARFTLGFTRPRQAIRGVDFAGEVAEVGAGVSRFAVGQRVFGLEVNGSHAEFMLVKADGAIAAAPEAMSWTDAAAIPFGGTTALHFLDAGKLRAGQKVLVYGASGAVGSAMVQIAVARGAEVTAVCSAANRELMLWLGASRVVDYTSEPVFADGDRYDVVCDTIGKLSPKQAAPATAPGGVFLAVVSQPSTMLQKPTGMTVIGGVARPTAAQVDELRRLVEQGTLKPVIDEVFPFAQMRAAHTVVDGGHKRGNVVVRIAA